MSNQARQIERALWTISPAYVQGQDCGEWSEFLPRLQNLFESLVSHGCEIGQTQVASTGSNYISTWITGEVATRIFGADRANGMIDEFGEGEMINITIRVSDHGSAYCSEELSFSLNPSGDDHDIEEIINQING